MIFGEKCKIIIFCQFREILLYKFVTILIEVATREHLSNLIFKNVPKPSLPEAFRVAMASRRGAARGSDSTQYTTFFTTPPLTKS